MLRSRAQVGSDHAARRSSARCSTDAAPWFIVPADRKWYRNLAVAEILADTAAEMNPSWPTPEEDLSEVVIPD